MKEQPPTWSRNSKTNKKANKEIRNLDLFSEIIQKIKLEQIPC